MLRLLSRFLRAPFQFSKRAAFEGAYFAKQLAQAKAEGRIGHVDADPILPYKAFFDLGGTAARADALAIWIVQFVGREIRVLDYFEGVGQEIGYYIAELRKRKYDQALLVPPHDGDAHHGPINRTYRTHFQDVGLDVDVIPNQGSGAAMLRIEAARRVFPRCWFNEESSRLVRCRTATLYCCGDRRRSNRRILARLCEAPARIA